MKKLLLLACTALVLSSCADSKVIDGKIYEPYGWANNFKQDPAINYQVCVGNVLWSIVLCETLVVPVVLTGYSFYEPVSKK